MMKYRQRNNMNKIITFLGALIAASSLNAQSQLVFIDQDGTEVGTLVNFDEPNGQAWSRFAVLRRGEYFMRINLETGEISPSTFYYNSGDCSGTPYVIFDRGGNTRGGVIVYTRNVDSPILGLVEWYPEIQTNSFRSAHELGGPTSECDDYTSMSDGVPVTIVAPADYGISKIPEVKPGDTGLGFKGPLVPKIKQSEVIFCNGLENCPVQ